MMSKNSCVSQGSCAVSSSKRLTDIKRRAKQHGFEVLKISHRHDQAKLGKTELDNWLKFAEHQAHEVTALETAVKLSSERYVAGKASCYEVLEAQQQLFPSQINLARAQRDQLLAVVTLYKDARRRLAG